MKKGFVYQRGKYWCVAIPDANAVGGYRRKSGFRTKSDAHSYLEKFKYQISDVQVKGKGEGNLVFKQAFKEVLDHVASNLTAETHKSYHGIIKDFLIFMGQKYPHAQWLHELRPKVFDDYKLWLRDTGYQDQQVRRHHKSATVNNHLKVLKAIFSRFISWEYIGENPLKKVMTVVVDDDKPIVTLNTPAKFDLFFTRCKAIKPEYFSHYFCTAKLGLRFGELVSLRWANVDFENKVIRIVRSKGRSKRDKKQKERILPMAPDIEETLMGLPQTSEFVFLKDSKPISKRDKSFRRWLIAIVKGTELEGMTRVHELRHSTGDILGQSHSIYDIKAFLGHSDIRTTERYVRVADEAKKRMAETLGGFGSVTQKTTQKTNE